MSREMNKKGHFRRQFVEKKPTKATPQTLPEAHLAPLYIRAQNDRQPVSPTTLTWKRKETRYPGKKKEKKDTKNRKTAGTIPLVPRLPQQSIILIPHPKQTARHNALE